MLITRRMEALQLEIDQLKSQLSRLQVTHKVEAKDVSLVTSIKDWTEAKSGRSVDFFTQVESLAKVNDWTDKDKELIVKAKCQGHALQFLTGQDKMTRDACSNIEL
jgi:hypothetical protein